MNEADGHAGLHEGSGSLALLAGSDRRARTSDGQNAAPSPLVVQATDDVISEIGVADRLAGRQRAVAAPAGRAEVRARVAGDDDWHRADGSAAYPRTEGVVRFVADLPDGPLRKRFFIEAPIIMGPAQARQQAGGPTFLARTSR